MKKYYFFLLFAFATITSPIFAAEADSSLAIPDGVGFGSIGAVVALTLFITEVIKGAVSLKGFGAQSVSWGVGIVVSLIGWWLKIGIFTDIGVYEFIFYAISITLASNGIFKVPVIKKILDALFNYLKSSEKTSG